MGYRYRRLSIHYSQNNLSDPELVRKLLRNSSIGKKDTVLEIGPGKGIITIELVKAAGQVIAIEKDINLYENPKSRFINSPNLELVNSDFLTYSLPTIPYKVFANIPFNITADIIRRLIDDPNFQDGYLIVQKEAAQRFVGVPYDNKNQMLSVLLKPWFNISVLYEFERSDFVPRPHVDSAMIRLVKLKTPRVSYNLREMYKDFIVYNYNHTRLSRTSFEVILKKFERFNLFTSKSGKYKISYLAKRITKAQENIQKIHRTRNDINWRKF